ncbi:TPA: autotransporter outer membrane beta-barrel domain-containing protein [Citrobacter farmeri]|nr:autotransporter outer membrane beta-barrel domain-containing protein [Citrobacter farmeri]
MLKIKSLRILSALACYVPVVFSAEHNGLNITSLMKIGSGDSITSSAVDNGGILEISGRADSSNITVRNDGLMILTEGQDRGSVIEEGGRQYIASNEAYAHDTQVSGEQWVIGGRVSETTIMNNGVTLLYSNATAARTTLKDNARMEVTRSFVRYSSLYGTSTLNVREGSHTYLVNLYDKSALNIFSDTHVDDVETYGNSTITTHEGSVVHFITANDKSLIQANGGEIISVTMSGESSMSVNSGANVNSVYLNDSAFMNINQGGEAHNINIHGDLAKINLNGGSLTHVNIDRGELIAQSGELRGRIDSQEGQVTLEKDVISDQADVNLEGTSELLLRKYDSDASYSLKSLSLNQSGSVRFDNPHSSGGNGWNILTVNTLEGNGNFYMNTEVASRKGDFLNVTGNASGSHKVFVKDTGVSPTEEHRLLLVKAANGDATFSLGNRGGVVDLGAWEYTLKEEEQGVWALTPDLTKIPEPEPTPEPEPNPDTPSESGPALPPKPENIKKRITPSTAAVLNMAAVEPLVFDAELDSIRERIDGRVSLNRGGAVWSTLYNTRNDASTSAGAGFDQTLTGVTIGADHTFRMQNSAATTGAFFTYSHSNVDFDRGGKGNVDSYSLGAYAGWQHSNGLYVDGIVKVNRFENDVQGRMTSGGSANGSYSAYGAGTHLESGIRLYSGDLSVTPYAALTGFTTDSNKYALSNGMRADVDNTRMMRAEAGLKTAYRVVLENGIELQPWVKASVRQEYADDNKIKVNDDGRFVNDLSGTRGVYQTGIRAKFTDDLSGHLSASYANGANIESPWRAAAGITWSF